MQALLETELVLIPPSPTPCWIWILLEFVLNLSLILPFSSPDNSSFHFCSRAVHKAGEMSKEKATLHAPPPLEVPTERESRRPSDVHKALNVAEEHTQWCWTPCCTHWSQWEQDLAQLRLFLIFYLDCKLVKAGTGILLCACIVSNAKESELHLVQYPAKRQDSLFLNHPGGMPSEPLLENSSEGDFITSLGNVPSFYIYTCSRPNVFSLKHRELDTKPNR